MLLWGWALAQWPYIIYPDLTFQAAAAPDATLGFILATAPVGGLLLVPSLLFLFAIFVATLAKNTRSRKPWPRAPMIRKSHPVSDIAAFTASTGSPEPT